MLFNLTHQITNCGLPSHVQERYVRYKQGNRAIVAWMTKYGPERYKGRKNLPIKQLIALGQLLCDKVQEIGTLPPDVDYYFTEVIKERTYLSHHFRGHRDQCEEDRIDTVNHEHFTRSLQDIHQILLTAGRSRKEYQKPNPHVSSQPDSPTTSTCGLQNRYNRLALDSGSDYEDDDRSSMVSVDTKATSECCHDLRVATDCAAEDNDGCEDFLDIEGDVAMAMETSIFMNRVNDSFVAIESHWAQAGRGEIPTLAAACITNIICGNVLYYAKIYSSLTEQETSLSDMQKVLGKLTRLCKDQHQSTDHSSIASGIFDLFGQVHRAMTDKPKPSANRTVEKPWELIDFKSSTSTAQEPQLAYGLVRNLVQSMQELHLPSLCQDGIPCYDILCAQLQDGQNQTVELGAILILSMLCISYIAYIQALDEPRMASMPRITALKLAREAATSINKFINDKDIFPCQCVNTLGFRMAETVASLEAFAKHNSWTLLMQSPQIGNNNILEILDLCSHYGMHLFHYRQYVGAVLHSYNVMVNVGEIEPMPLMEELCELFKTVLFSSGSRPRSNFTSSWLRYIGARLKFRKGRREQNHKDTWCMSIPPHAASRAAGLNIDRKNQSTNEPKFDYGSIDFIMKLKRQKWQVDGIEGQDYSEDTSNIVSCKDCTPTTTPRRKRRSRRASSLASFRSLPSPEVKSEWPSLTGAPICAHILPSILTCLQDRTDTIPSVSPKPLSSPLQSGSCQPQIKVITKPGDLPASLPTARLNLFAVFYTMTRIIRRISNATHNDSSSQDSPAERGSLCLCFTTLLLRAADRIQDTRRKTGRLDAKGASWSGNERQCLNALRDAIVAEVESDSMGKNRKAWLWSI